LPTPRDTKAFLKRSLKRAAWLAGSLRPDRADLTRILTYHSVGTRRHDMNVLPNEFERQVEWLARACPVVSLSQAADLEPGVAITFDDGYRDSLTHAAPVLARFRLPATFFIVAGRVGGFLDHDEPTEDARLLSWKEILDLAAMGFDIGGHTLTHRRLAALSHEEQREEVQGCATLLREHVGTAPRSFAYPFGSALDYTERSKQLARETGYAYAVSNRYGPNARGADRWALRRIWIDATDSLEMFQAKVTGRLDALVWMDSSVGTRARRWMNRALQHHRSSGGS